MKHLLLLVTALLFSQLIFAQSPSIQGKIYDAKTEESLPFANIVLLKKDIQIAGTTTDFDGKYSLTGFEPGTYALEVSYVGYQKHRIEEIPISSDQTVALDVEMSEPPLIIGCDVGFRHYITPLIDDHYDTSTGNTMNSREISKMAF